MENFAKVSLYVIPWCIFTATVCWLLAICFTAIQNTDLCKDYKTMTVTSGLKIICSSPLNTEI